MHPQRGPITREAVKASLANLVVDEELPFTIVDSSAFRNFAELCNPAVIPHLVKSTALAEAITEKFRLGQSVIKAVLSKEPHISLTGDMWTSSNGNSIFGITAHWINEKFKPFEAIIAMKQVIGAHTGTNLAAHVEEVMTTYGIKNQLFCFTADNASNNGTMGVCLEAIIPQFQASQHLIGCLAHVINLSACAGLEVFSKHLTRQPLSLPNTLASLVDKIELNDTSGALVKIDGLTKLPIGQKRF